MDFLSVFGEADWLAFGAFPGMLGLGWAAFRLALGRSERMPLGLALACSLALGNAGFVGAAFLMARHGHYHAGTLGGTGWVLFASVAAIQARAIWRARGRMPLAERRDWAGLGALAGLFVFYAAFPDESLLGMRDQGVYFMRGMAIERTGSLDAVLPSPLLDASEFRVLRDNLNPNGLYFRGDGRADWQFSPYLPLNYAQAYAAFGYRGIQWFNPFLAAGSALLFVWICRRFMGWGWSAFAGLAFAFNLPQIWNARITLSEPLAQAFLLCGLAAATWASRRGCWRGMALGGCVAMASAWARVDALLFGALLAAGYALWKLWSGGGHLAGWRGWAFPAGLLAVGLSGAWMYWDASRPYFLAFREELWGFAGCFALAVVGVWASAHPSLQPFLRRVLGGERLRWALAGGLVVLALYAYLLRPELEPFHASVAPHEAGQRSFREETLRFYSHYLSLPVLALGVAGACVALWRVLGGRQVELGFLLAAWLGFALLYSYDPRISNDHIWRMRRFVPIVLPGLAFFAAYAASAASRRWLSAAAARGSLVAAGCLGAAAFYSWRAAPVYPNVGYEGAIETLEEVARAIPEDALTIGDLHPFYAGPLHLALGLDLVRANLGDKRERELASRVAKAVQAEGRPIYVVTTFPVFDDSHLRPVRSIRRELPVLRPTPQPPVGDYVGLQATFETTRIDMDLLPSLATIRSMEIGAYPAYRVEETGLHAQERGAGLRPFRWTDGAARFELAAHPLNPVAEISLRVAGTPPGGGIAEFRALGETIFRSDSIRAGDTVIVEVPDRLRRSPFEIEIVSNRWVPAEASPSRDTRRLGLRLESLELRFANPDSVGAARLAPALDGRIASEGLHELEEDGEGAFRWTDGKARFSGRFLPAFEPAWLQLDFRMPELGDNEVRLLWNGRGLEARTFSSGRHRWEVALPQSQAGADWELTIESDAFRPIDEGIGNDERTLGIRMLDLVVR